MRPRLAYLVAALVGVLLGLGVYTFQYAEGLAENAVLALMDAVQAAMARGARAEALVDARAFHRKAQWRLDFVAAENSKGFHAPQEAARILGEAIDYARRGQAAALVAGR